MPLTNPNYSSNTASVVHDYVNRNRIDKTATFRLIDIGSRGGIRSEWSSIQAYSQFVGFDANAEECARLNALYPNIESHPIALAGKSGIFPFYITKSSHCYGFRKINEEFWSRFPNAINNEVKDVIDLEATSFDEWVFKTNYTHIDFIKLDTEGSESDIISGMKSAVSSKKILGILSEIWFEGTTKVGGDYGFASLDALLQSLGYQLFDIEVSRYPRTTMPVGKLSMEFDGNNSSNITASVSPMRKYYGQVLTGDVLYFRDPILDWKNNASDAEKFWDDETILRLIVILELYNYQDVALEILAFFQHKFPKVLKETLISALLKQSTAQGEINIPYSEYWRVSKELFVSSGGCNEPELANELDIKPANFD